MGPLKELKNYPPGTGGYLRGREGKVFAKPVDKCTKKQLMPITLDKVAPGVDVYTDEWRSYDALAVSLWLQSQKSQTQKRSIRQRKR